MVVVDGDDEAARFTLTRWEQRLQQRGHRVVFVALDHNRAALLGVIETEDTNARFSDDDGREDLDTQ